MVQRADSYFGAMRILVSLVLLVAAPRCAAAAAPPLPRLSIVGRGSLSGISSGADLAPMLHVIFSERFLGSGAFAGQAFGCAVTRFSAEPQFLCAQQPAGAKGPGCVGLDSCGGPTPCVGCDNASATVAYDHCKKTPEIIEVSRLQAWAAAAAAADRIAPLENLRDARVYTYRGTLDSVYLPGSVNATGAFFAPFVDDPAGQVVFVSSVPSQHSQPSVDPHVPRDTCGKSSVGGVQNCGYDGVGAMLQHFYSGTLIAPPDGASLDPSRLLAFDQDAYGDAAKQFGGLASTGYVYVPRQCTAASACRVHVALHGCGQSAVEPKQGTLYVSYGGYAPWADANGIIILYPQGGGFFERNWTTAHVPRQTPLRHHHNAPTHPSPIYPPIAARMHAPTVTPAQGEPGHGRLPRWLRPGGRRRLHAEQRGRHRDNEHDRGHWRAELVAVRARAQRKYNAYTDSFCATPQQPPLST